MTKRRKLLSRVSDLVPVRHESIYLLSSLACPSVGAGGSGDHVWRRCCLAVFVCG